MNPANDLKHMATATGENAKESNLEICRESTYHDATGDEKKANATLEKLEAENHEENQVKKCKIFRDKLSFSRRTRNSKLGRQHMWLKCRIGSKLKTLNYLSD